MLAFGLDKRQAAVHQRPRKEAELVVADASYSTLLKFEECWPFSSGQYLDSKLVDLARLWKLGLTENSQARSFLLESFVLYRHRRNDRSSLR